jgi:hypothetical protein
VSQLRGVGRKVLIGMYIARGRWDENIAKFVSFVQFLMLCGLGWGGVRVEG